MARIIRLREFRGTTIRRDSHTGEFYTSLRDDMDGFLPVFPMIIQSDNKPWKIGNIYLAHKALDLGARNYSYATQNSRANYLIHYLRFLEETGMTYLDVHGKRYQKVTYRFRNHLLAKIDSSELNRDLAANIMRTVVDFYKVLSEEEIISENLIDDEILWKKKKATISYINSQGFKRLLERETTDLAIKSKNNHRDENRIYDGGKLNPLSQEHQEVYFGVLKTVKSDSIKLIHLFTYFTGSRLQTVCTLRIKNILELSFGTNNVAILKAGEGTNIDTKFGKRLDIEVPKFLADILKDHIQNEKTKKARDRSYYGDTVENYVFLTRNGTPYYTSRKELRDRVNDEMDDRVKTKHTFSIQNGKTIQNHVSSYILPMMQKIDPTITHFQFHDLRATFGMNTLEETIEIIKNENNLRRNQGIPELSPLHEAEMTVRRKLGHTRTETTRGYLNYRALSTWKIPALDANALGMSKDNRILIDVLSSVDSTNNAIQVIINETRA